MPTNRVTYSLNARTNPMAAEIYAVKAAPQPEVFVFTKFDRDLEPLSTYLVSRGECNCPRGEAGRVCRHRDMLPTFLKAKHIGDGFMFNYSTRQWLKPHASANDALAERDHSPPPAATASHNSAVVDPPPEPQVLASAPPLQGSPGGGSNSFQKRKW